MIKLENVSKRVKSGTEDLLIVSDICLEIPGSQFVALTGPSGSGKSTLLGLMAGLDDPSEGNIEIDGASITGMGEDGLARLRGEKIGFVFQSFHLIPSLTALENVAIPMEIMGRADASTHASELLKDVGLSDRGHHYPHELSGGEQQRVSIARAFSNDPKILLADEPTGNLDSRNGRHILEIMTKMHAERGVTLVLVTHDAALADAAERRVSLVDGRIAEDVISQ